MALGSPVAGRPYYEAAIPFQNARKVALLEEFYGVCRTFHVQEIIQVSRGLGINERTVRRWKYAESFPRWDIAIDVIEWTRQGKPLRKRYQSENREGIF